MAFTRVAQSNLYLSGFSTTALDTTTSLTLQTGDLLFFVGCFNSAAVATFADVDGGHSATLFNRVGDGSSGYLRTGYFLSATAGTKNFRLSLSVASTYTWFCVLQYRPDSGYVAALDAGPSPSSVTTSSSLASGAITTTGPGLIIGSLSHGYLQTATSPLIGTETATLYPATGANFFGALDLITTSAKTAVQAKVTIDGWRTWVMDVAAFKEESSGGGTVDVTPVGLSSTPSVSRPTVQNVQSVSPSGLTSSTEVGSPSIANVQSVSPIGLVSESIVGSPSVANVQSVVPSGLSAGPSVGSPSIANVQSVVPIGLSASTSVGSPSVSNVQSVQPSGLSAGPTVGRPTISTGQEFSPVGLVAETTLGKPSVSNVQSVSPVGVYSTPTLGRPTILTDDEVSPVGIVAQPSVGSPSVSNVQSVSMRGLSVATIVGKMTILGPVIQGPTLIKDHIRTIGAVVSIYQREATADILDHERLVYATVVTH